MATPNAPARLAVLISGGGRTLANLQDEIVAGRLPATIELVVSSAENKGSALARGLGLTTLVVPGVIPGERLAVLLKEHRIDLVILAGYLKLLNIPKGYEERVLNIHPALLPRHGGPGMYGHRVHEAVLKAGDAESGCTVHLCTPQYDEGPVLVQRRCPVLPGDTPDTLAARVFELEKLAYPEAIRRYIAAGYRREEL